MIVIAKAIKCLERWAHVVKRMNSEQWTKERDYWKFYIEMAGWWLILTVENFQREPPIHSQRIAHRIYQTNLNGNGAIGTILIFIESIFFFNLFSSSLTLAFVAKLQLPSINPKSELNLAFCFCIALNECNTLGEAFRIEPVEFSTEMCSSTSIIIIKLNYTRCSKHLPVRFIFPKTLYFEWKMSEDWIAPFSLN